MAAAVFAQAAFWVVSLAPTTSRLSWHAAARFMLEARPEADAEISFDQASPFSGSGRRIGQRAAPARAGRNQRALARRGDRAGPKSSSVMKGASPDAGAYRLAQHDGGDRERRLRPSPGPGRFPARIVLVELGNTSRQTMPQMIHFVESALADSFMAELGDGPLFDAGVARAIAPPASIVRLKA